MENWIIDFRKTSSISSPPPLLPNVNRRIRRSSKSNTSDHTVTSIVEGSTIVEAITSLFHNDSPFSSGCSTVLSSGSVGIIVDDVVWLNTLLFCCFTWLLISTLGPTGEGFRHWTPLERPLPSPFVICHPKLSKNQLIMKKEERIRDPFPSLPYLLLHVTTPL